MLTSPYFWLGLAMLLVVGPVWHYARYVVTLVHESGHALPALLFGGRWIRVKVLAASGGSTDWAYDDLEDHTAIIPLLTGYLAPPALGLAGLWAMHRWDSRLCLLVLAGICVVILPMIRNLFGLLMVLLVGGGSYAAARYTGAEIQMAVVGTLSWVMMAGGVRDTLSILVGNDGDQKTDDEFLEDATGVPAGIWRVLFVLLTVCLLGLGLHVGFGWSLLVL